MRYSASQSLQHNRLLFINVHAFEERFLRLHTVFFPLPSLSENHHFQPLEGSWSYQTPKTLNLEPQTVNHYTCQSGIIL